MNRKQPPVVTAQKYYVASLLSVMSAPPPAESGHQATAVRGVALPSGRPDNGRRSGDGRTALTMRTLVDAMTEVA